MAKTPPLNINEIHLMHRVCEECPLNGTSKRVRDRGKRNAKIAFVGEAPHTNEIEQGVPFVGRSGQLLDVLLDYIQLPRQSVVLANALKCKLDKSNLPRAVLTKAIKTCRPFVYNTLAKVRPKLIVVMGDIALRQILGKSGITRYRGRFFWSEEFNATILPTVHPAYVLRGCQRGYPNIPLGKMSSKERMIFRDFDLIRGFIDNKYKPVQIDTTEYTEINNMKGFKKASPLAFDLEWDPETGEAICSSFCNAPGRSKVFFFDGKSNMEDLKKVMANEKIKKIVGNRPVDENKLLELGVETKGTVYDVFTMAHLVDENMPNISLENIANAYTDLPNIKDMAEGQRLALSEADREVVIRYSAVDSDATFRAYTTLKEKLMEDKRVLRYYAKFVLPVEDMLAKVSRTGCKINISKLKKNIKFFDSEMKRLHHKLLLDLPQPIQEKYKDDLSLTRAVILIDFLFKHRSGLRLKPVMFTEKTRQPSTKADHLKRLAEIEWVTDYLNWKRLQKFQSTYLKPMFKFLKEDGKVYPNILLYRTVTGRTSIVNPPIQQIPQRGDYINYIRELFVADKGWVFGARDLAQSEIRVIGWVAGEQKILRALREGIDLHVLTASAVMGVPMSEVTPLQRQRAKPINFGFIYGMYPQHFVDYARDEYGIHYTLQEAKLFRQNYFKTYPAILGYHNYMNRLVSKQGYIYTPLGRKRRLPGIYSDDPLQRSLAIRQAINTPIQSFSSDLALIGMKLFQDEIDSDPELVGNAKILWFKHDEVFFSAKKEVFDYAMKRLKVCMEYHAKVYIKDNFGLVVDYPVESDGKKGTSWANMKEYKDKEKK